MKIWIDKVMLARTKSRLPVICEVIIINVDIIYDHWSKSLFEKSLKNFFVCANHRNNSF